MYPELRRILRSIAVAGSALCLGCAPDPVPVDLRIIHAPATDPFAGADTIRMELEANGAPVEEWTFGIDETEGLLPALPTGTGLVLRVEILGGGIVFARGHSYPFDLVPGSPAPHPDVYVGQLGRFAEPIAAAFLGEVRAAVATGDGALLVTSLGDIHRFRAHDRRTGHAGEPSIERVASVPSPADRTYVGVPPGRILAFGGSAGGAILYDAEGATRATLPPDDAALVPHAFGAAAVALGSGAVLLVGGASMAVGPESAEVTRLEVVDASDPWTLATEALPPLATPRRDARIAAASMLCQMQVPCERVVVLGGMQGPTPVMEVSSLDPEGLAPRVDLATDVARPGATLFPFEPGFVVVAGGEGPDGVAVDQVDELRILEASDGERLDVLFPRPEPLFFPRSGGAALVFGPRLGLIVGGVDATGAPAMTAEILEHPGSALPTGSLTTPAASPQAVLLGDGTALVADDGTLALYVLPRGL